MKSVRRFHGGTISVGALGVLSIASVAIVSAAITSTAMADPGDQKTSAPPSTSPLSIVSAAATDSAAIDLLIPKIDVKLQSLRPQALDQTGKPRPNDFWWPNLIDLSSLHRHESVNPLGADFSYPKAFAQLDLRAVRKDLRALMHDSKDWWPADYGTYGPFFIRMAWHSAGTYRAADGRGGADGGQQRFEPLNSWPDNANLDKARRLIQPLVDKYYPKLSWADAMILAGDEAMRDMGFQTLGVAGGRTDDWAPDLVYWGPEDKFLESHRFDENGNLMPPLAASVLGLIYVNPEGADGKPDPRLSANHIRITFGRMGMDDEETVALIAGGHTFGKTHGAHKPDDCLTGPPPAGAPVDDQQLGWKNRCGKGNAEDTVTSGLEGPWTSSPTHWTHEYLSNLYKYDWQLHKGAGGKYQWYVPNLPADAQAPGAHTAQLEPLMMLTTDLALRYDPVYREISTRYLNDPREFEKAFGRAWFKLIHRDLGPKSRYLGHDFPKENFIWQDPVPPVSSRLVDAADVETLKAEIKHSTLSISDLVKTAWAGAATYRGTDMRGGINGSRLRLAPEKDWEVNEPETLQKNLASLEAIRAKFNAANTAKNKTVSLADLIVIAGNLGVEEAAAKAGRTLQISFTPGRTDTSQAQTDTKSFQYLKVASDGFRNYYNAGESYLNPAQAFVDRADMLTLNVSEMTVLTGGLRILGANYHDSKNGVFTKRPGVLTNDFFINLLDPSTTWSLSEAGSGAFVGRDRKTGMEKWTATTHDLIFGSSSELRYIAFTYASPNAEAKFVRDFASAWTKVMNLDRFDLKAH